MTARAISTATVTFGLVTIPVKLYSTSQPEARVSFHWLHEECGSRVKMQYYCPEDDKIVDRDQLVRGFEVSKGRYVPVEAEELAAVKEKARDALDVMEFVPADTISPLFFEHTYYLGPDRRGGKAYALFARALERSGKVAVARQAARGQEHIVVIRPEDGLLILQQLRFADEVRSRDEIPLEEQKVSEKELELAEKLIEQTAVDEFRAEDYHDEVRARTQALLEQKIEAGEVREQPEGVEAEEGRVIDLMEALKASLSHPRKDKEEKGGEKAGAHPAKKRARHRGARAG